jgi:hypothetical protein
MIDLLLPYRKYLNIAIAVVFAAAMLVSYQLHQSAVESLRESTKAQVVLELQQKLQQEKDKLQAEAASTTKDLQQNIQKQRKESDAKVENLYQSYLGLLSLIDSYRSTGLPAYPAATSSSTVSNPSRDSRYSESTDRIAIAGLSAKNAKDLAEYSRDSERLRLELLMCYKQYESVQQGFEEYKLKTKPQVQ